MTTQAKRNGVASDNLTSRLFAELASCVQQLGAKQMIDNLQEMRLLKNRNNPMSIDWVISIAAAEFDISIDDLINGNSYGQRIDCIKIINYLLYNPEDADGYSARELIRLLPWGYTSPSVISKHRQYILNLSPNVPYHQDLIEKMDRIKHVIDTTNIEDGQERQSKSA